MLQKYRYKGVLEAATFICANKTKEFISSRKLGCLEFWRNTNSVLKKGKSAIHPLLNGIDIRSASNKEKLVPDNFSKSNLVNSGIILPAFSSRTYLKLKNMFLTLELVKRVITNPDSSKASDSDCIPVVALKNCESELSYVLAELFNMCLKESFL